MKHHDKNRKFGRDRDQRRALLRSLAIALVKNEKIKTTEAKAKELRPYIEKLITRGKTANIVSRRLISSRLGNDVETTKKIIDVISPKYKERNGGYTRVIKMSNRTSDASPMAIIEFV